MATNPGSDNLISWHALDETSGNRSDEHTNNYTLTDVNTVLYAAGKQGNAADFERDNLEYLYHNVQIKSTLYPYGDNPLTITGWVKLESKHVTQNATFAAVHADAGVDKTWIFKYDTSDDRFQLVVYDDAVDTGVVNANTLGSPSLATWYFVVGYHDPVANEIGISVNAGTIDTLAWTDGMLTNPADATNKFTVGSQDSNGNQYMDGLLDELTVWGKVLSQDEIDWLYNSGAGRVYADLTIITEVPLRSLTLTTYAPTVSPINVGVPLKSLTLTTYAPTIELGIITEVPLRALTLTTYAPLIGAAEVIHIRTADGATLLGTVVDGDGTVVFSDGENWYSLRLPKLT